MREKKISIVRLKCVIDSKDIEFSEVYDTNNLTKGKEYILIDFNDDDEGNIQFKILNDKRLPYYYSSTLFEVIHND